MPAREKNNLKNNSVIRNHTIELTDESVNNELSLKFNLLSETKDLTVTHSVKNDIECTLGKKSSF